MKDNANESHGEPKYPLIDAIIRFADEYSNAFVVVERVWLVLRRARYSARFIEQFTKEVMFVSKDHLFLTVMKYVEVE